MRWTPGSRSPQSIYNIGRRLLVGLFNDISTFLGYIMPNLLEEAWEDKGVHTFSKGISLKGNVITRLEFELVYNNSAVQRFNHYITWTLLHHYWPWQPILFRSLCIVSGLDIILPTPDSECVPYFFMTLT